MKTAISTKAKKITQPSGAATPRNSDTHERIAVPRLSAFFESALDQGSKAAKFAVLTPGPGMFVNVQLVSRVMIPPPSETPPVSACKPLCAILLRKPSVYPLSPVRANVSRLREKLKIGIRSGLKQRCGGNFLAIVAEVSIGEKSNFTGRFFEWRRPFDFSKIKGRSRKRPRPGHKAPQCGAFRGFETAV